jgi:hypothetical protein
MVSEFIFLHHFQPKVSEALTGSGGAIRVDSKN